MGGQQLGFSDFEQTTAKKQTKWEKFLAEMEAVVPWDALITTCPGKRRVLFDQIQKDLIEMAKAHVCVKGEHPFRVIKQQIGFQKSYLRGLIKNDCKINVMAALSNLFQARRHLLASD